MRANTSGVEPTQVTVSPRATALEDLAAREIVRYLYLRTGQFLPITVREAPGRRSSVVVATKGQQLAPEVGNTLRPEQWRLHRGEAGGVPHLFVTGGDGVGALYGAYRLAELLGVRYYLSGDVIPDSRIPLSLDIEVDEGYPIFSTRGLHPFHDFPEGPDWWTLDDYLAVTAQMTKLRLNFLGLHCYPPGHAPRLEVRGAEPDTATAWAVGALQDEATPEPAVWQGMSADLGPDGTPTLAYPALWASTARHRNWGYAAMRTSEYAGGASQLFEAEYHGPTVMDGLLPIPSSPEESIELFRRVARLFDVAFSTARALGIKIGLGIEVPLVVPIPLADELRRSGRDPDDPEVRRDVFAGTFEWIARNFQIDVFEMWTTERWTWEGNAEDQTKRVAEDIQLANEALDAVGRPFTIALFGWVIGPAENRLLFHEVLPHDAPIGALNRQFGHNVIDPAFAEMPARRRWPITWIENDPALVSPQLWVGRMRYDAWDARRLGCDGLLAALWRTKVTAPTTSAFADAAWNQPWDRSPDAAVPPTPEYPRHYSITTAGDIAGTTEPGIYRSCRTNIEHYRLELPNGSYALSLKFVEFEHSSAGKRVFDVAVQGQPVAIALDLAARAGVRRAFDLEVAGVVVDDHELVISFSDRVGVPSLAGLVVTGREQELGEPPLVRKINCGGPRYRDYEADPVPLYLVHPPSPELRSHRRSVPVGDFYLDFCRSNFGDEVASPAARILEGVDGMNLPETSTWAKGPGGIKIDPRPWNEVRPGYAFVEEFGSLRSTVRGPGNLARFDYWANTLRLLRATAEVGCRRGELDVVMLELADAATPGERSRLSAEALSIRLELSRCWERLLTLQLAATETVGDIGTVANLEQHNRRFLGLLDAHDETLQAALGRPLPPDVAVSMKYTGAPRLIVPTARTLADPGEGLAIKVVILSHQAPDQLHVSLRWRSLGRRRFRTVPLRHVGRGVFAAELPPIAARSVGIEYFVTALVDGSRLRFPVTAPNLNQTVVLHGRTHRSATRSISRERDSRPGRMIF